METAQCSCQSQEILGFASKAVDPVHLHPASSASGLQCQESSGGEVPGCAFVADTCLCMDSSVNYARHLSDINDISLLSGRLHNG